jgi:hypothetical protein
VSATSLTDKPDAARHQVQLNQANRIAHRAYQTLTEAAADYLDAQVELVVAAWEAHNAGLTVTVLHTSWLDTPPEEAVIQARVEADQEASAPSRSTTRSARSWRRSAATATHRPCASKTSRSSVADRALAGLPHFRPARPTPERRTPAAGLNSPRHHQSRAARPGLSPSRRLNGSSKRQQPYCPRVPAIDRH